MYLMIHGMQVITDAKEKDEALEALVEHLIPGKQLLNQ